MLYPQKNSSSLPLYFLVSLGIHIIILTTLIIIMPNLEKTKPNKITVQLQSNIPNLTFQGKELLPIPNKKTTIPKNKIIKKSFPKKQIKTKPIIKSSSIAIPKPEISPHSIPIENKKSPKLKPPKKVQASSISDIPKPIIINEKDTSKNTKKIITPNQSELLANELDSILNQNITIKKTQDFLENASWSGSPRKTIAFPNLNDKIASQYQSRGYGFSVTAKIIFSPQGWVSSVELLQSSGDPRIDRIFRNELRKIRIEESPKENYDTIIKTFTISIK